MKTIRLQGEDYTRYMQNKNGARRAIQKSYFDEFGPVRFTQPSGRNLGPPVRIDPGEAGPEDEAIVTTAEESVSEERMEAQSDAIRRQRNSGHVLRAPKPRACKCKEWPWPEGQSQERDSAGKPTNHHPKCAFNKMYERQTGNKIAHVAAGPTLEPRIHRAGKVTNHASSKAHSLGKPSGAQRVKEKIQKVPHPDRCPKCKDFTKSKKMEQDQHHPTCEFYKKFKAISGARANAGMPAPKPEPVSSKIKIVLWDLDTQEAVREAEPDEIQAAQVALRDTGTPIVVVDEASYLVMHEDGTSLEPAEVSDEVLSGEGEGDTEPPAQDSNLTAADQDSNLTATE